jgi:hypothetical protein
VSDGCFTKSHGRVKPTPGRDRDASWFHLGAAILLLASPLRHLWAGDARPWFLPYLVWIALIAAVWLGERRSDGDR